MKRTSHRYSCDFRYWHIPSFRCDAEFGRYRGIADIDQARFMISALEHRRPASA
jgi:hypothetical protein